jgi:hypothetical protein
LEALYQQRKTSGGSKKHSPQLSLSDDTHHVTETIHSWYDQESPIANTPHLTVAGIGIDMAGDDARRAHSRPLSYINAPSERESFEARRQRRHGTLMDSVSVSSPNGSLSPTSPPSSLPQTPNDDTTPSPTTERNGSNSPSRQGSRGGDSTHGQDSPTSVTTPTLSRQASTDTAVQQFPLNDIDYESSPAAVAQELSNLQAIRRMSMNVDTADPDLPSFGGPFASIPNVPDQEDEDDPSKLFWVPARLHPELAPKEFKTFIEDRVDKIRRRSNGEDTLLPEGPSRSSSSASSLRRKKSMLSHSIDTRGNYQDGAELLERKRSKGMKLEGQTMVANLNELEELVNDPAELVRRMSLENQRRSQDSGVEVPQGEDMPIMPPGMGALKRSTRTTYRRGSLKKGERAPFSKRAAHRHADSEADDQSASSATRKSEEQEQVVGLTRVQTEPTSPQRERMTSKQAGKNHFGQSHSSEDLNRDRDGVDHTSPPPSREEEPLDERAAQTPSSSQQPRQFQSRIASPGRTTAQLPGYDNKNPLPQIIETLPDGTKVPANNALQSFPERNSSHEIPRQFQRGGATSRSVAGRQNAPATNFDDISSNPSPSPGSGSSRTDPLTTVPTIDEKKSEKKEGSRKSSWKWILGGDDKTKDDPNSDSSGKSKSGKSKGSTDKARLDLLQNSIDGTTPSRGRESLVLNREDIKVEDERKKDGKKSDSSKKDKDKDSGLLSAIFWNKKKSSDGETKEKKKKADRRLSPEPAPRILKPDIDYNWTRFSILEERAIYRMAHIKLANPRRALYSQVLLSNFMYSYLAKVQMMHPQMQIPTAQRAAQQRDQEQQKQQQQQQQQQQPPEYNQYQRWQEVSRRVLFEVIRWLTDGARSKHDRMPRTIRAIVSSARALTWCMIINDKVLMVKRPPVRTGRLPLMSTEDNHHCLRTDDLTTMAQVGIPLQEGTRRARIIIKWHRRKIIWATANPLTSKDGPGTTTTGSRNCGRLLAWEVYVVVGGNKWVDRYHTTFHLLPPPALLEDLAHG